MSASSKIILGVFLIIVVVIIFTGEGQILGKKEAAADKHDKFSQAEIILEQEAYFLKHGKYLQVKGDKTTVDEVGKNDFKEDKIPDGVSIHKTEKGFKILVDTPTSTVMTSYIDKNIETKIYKKIINELTMDL